MSYCLNISRQPPITIDEWRKTISSIPDLKIEGGSSTGRSPASGKKMHIPWPKYTVWYYSQKYTGWRVLIPAIYSESTQGICADWNAPGSGAHLKYAFQIADKLGATIQGEGGETYTAETLKKAIPQSRLDY